VVPITEVMCALKMYLKEGYSLSHLKEAGHFKHCQMLMVIVSFKT